MRFDERHIGDYRVYAGALEGPQGDGYTAALIVQQVQENGRSAQEIHRDESLACGHRWACADAALAYAIAKAEELIRKRSTLLVC